VACNNHPDRDSVAACVICGAELCAECNNVGSDDKSYCAKDLPTEGTATAPAPVAAAPPPPAPAPAPAPTATAPPPLQAAAGSSSNLLAALAYPIWLIIALVIVASDMKRDRYMAYHGWNALFWSIGYAVVLVALEILRSVLHHIPGLGMLISLLEGAVPLVWLICSIIFAVKAYNRQDVNIPVISDMARKQVGG